MNPVIDDYEKQTSNSRTFPIQKGQLNKYRLRPSVLNEHAESSKTAQATVNNTTIAGQVFKASQDNINGIMLTLESAAGTSLDDFEGYANDAALQTAWALTGSNEATLETTIVKTGTNSMKLSLDTLNDEWALTVGDSIDYTGYTFDLDFFQDRAFAQAKVSFFIEDGLGASASTQLVIADINSWVHFEININSLTDDAGATDLTDIDKIGFRIDDAGMTFSSYVDNISATPEPGQLELKLWDLGDTIPVADGSSFDLATDATQYSELGDRGLNGGSVAASVILDLVGGKRLYTIRSFIAGTALEIPSNTILNMGNYYAITIHYVDTDVSVYGPDESFDNYYTNGYAFTTSAENVDITAIGTDIDLMFGVYSTQNVFINTLLKFYDAEPGTDATEHVFVEDCDMHITDVIAGENTPQQTLLAEFKDRTFYIPKGGKFEVYHNDDFSDSTSQITILIGYLYVPPLTNV